MAGRPRKYATPEEAAEAEKELLKKRGKKRNEKIKTNPEAKAKFKENKAKYEAKIPQEQKREYNTNYQSRRRAMLSQFKEIQIQASCEQSEEL